MARASVYTVAPLQTAAPLCEWFHELGSGEIEEVGAVVLFLHEALSGQEQQSRMCKPCALGLGRDLLIAHLEEKREAWDLSVHSSLNISSQYRIVMDTMVEAQAWDVPPPHTIRESCKIIRILKVSASDAKEFLNRRLTKGGRDCKPSSTIRRRNGQGEICGGLEQATTDIACKALKSYHSETSSGETGRLSLFFKCLISDLAEASRRSIMKCRYQSEKFVDEEMQILMRLPKGFCRSDRFPEEQRINVWIEHSQHCKSQENFLQQVKEKDEKEKEAKEKSSSIQLQHQPTPSREARFVRPSEKA
ncbi:hypothetical protein U0070_001072 [Myodes glareolus]|uniref:Uncharacterized protein n=1 Tax=Myodes glareolus TaxID=447135 RepID=A0AAW0IW31_MYOGA